MMSADARWFMVGVRVEIEMDLSASLASAARRIEKAPDAYLAARQAKAWLLDALANEDFICCICGFLIEGLGTDRTGWRLAPLPVPEKTPLCTRVLVWPGRYANEPHEHLGWTAAGVLLNRLEGTVLVRTPGSAKLEAQYRFSGGEGEVGVLDPPCIHQLSNPTDRTTVSLHIFATEEGGEAGDSAKHAGSGGSENRYSLGLRQRLELALIEILRRRAGRRRFVLFDRLFESGSTETKLAICQAIARANPQEAARRLAALAELVDDGAAAQRLRNLASRIAASH
jgi:hypothetical protein